MAFNVANLGQQITKKLTTGRLFFSATGSGPWTDYGNVTEYKYDPKITRKEHQRSSGGFKRTDMSLASAINPMYQILLDEVTPQLEQLRQVGTQGADAVQNANDAVVGEVLCNANSQMGSTFFTANMGLVAGSYTVKYNGGTMVEGTDYAIDEPSGAVTILNGGNIPNGSTVTINYSCLAVTMHTFSSFQSLLLQGYIKIIEYDQFVPTMPREITNFQGQLYVSAWGDNKADYNITTLDAIPLTNPVVLTRAD